MDDTHEWIVATDTAQVLKMSPRQVHRYGEAGKIRTKRAGRRVLYHAGDVQALAGHYRQPAAAQHDSRLAITSDAQMYLDQRRDQIHAALSALQRDLTSLPRLRVDDDGKLKLEALEKQDLLITLPPHA